MSIALYLGLPTTQKPNERQPYEETHLPDVSSSGVVETSGQALERIEQAAKEYLQQVGHRFDPIHPEAVVLVGEDVDEELARFARDQKVDIIAISSHGRTGLGRLFVGSHAQRMLEYGVAPVLIVRPSHLQEH
jgi:nucleotide-binding universal stress UspA family protein